MSKHPGSLPRALSLLFVVALAACSKPQAVAEAEPPLASRSAEVVRFDGFGPALFGDGEEAVRMSWGRPLGVGQAAEGSSCLVLAEEFPPPPGRTISFMFESGRFVRYDVYNEQIAAPGNLAVGSPVDAVRAAHAGRIEEQPHKYVEGGLNLIVSPADGRDGRLIFEVSPGGLVERWRMGLPPQVFYVEGCG